MKHSFLIIGTFLILQLNAQNVGIGTNSPNAKLHIHHEGSTEPTLLLDGAGDKSIKINADEAYLELEYHSSGSSWGIGLDDGPNLHIGHGTNGTFNKSKYLTVLAASGNVGIGTTNPQQLFTVSHASSPVIRFDRSASGAYDAEIYVSSGNVIFRGGRNGIGDELSDFATINASGRVGIGTTSPSQLFTVSDTTEPVIRLERSKGTSYDYEMYATSGGHLRFRGGLNASGASLHDYVTFSSQGRVGIGTMNPDTELHLVGGFKYEGGNPADGKVLISDADGNAVWSDDFNIPAEDQDYIWNRPVDDSFAIGQPDANFDITGNGEIGNRLNVGTAIGIGNTENSAYNFDVIVNSGNIMKLESLGSESDIYFKNNEGNWQVGINNDANDDPQFYLYTKSRYAFKIQEDAQIGITGSSPQIRFENTDDITETSNYLVSVNSTGDLTFAVGGYRDSSPPLPAVTMDDGGNLQAMRGFYTKKSYGRYKISDYSNESEAYFLGGWDFCALAGVGSRADDDTYDGGGDSWRNEGMCSVNVRQFQYLDYSNTVPSITSINYAYDNQPYWTLNVDVENQAARACEAICINFDY